MKAYSFEERLQQARESRIKENISTEHVKVFIENTLALQALSYRRGIDFTLFLAFLLGMASNNLVHMPAKMLAGKIRCCYATAKKRLNALCDAGLMRRTKTRDVYMVNPFLAVRDEEEDIPEIQALWQKASTIQVIVEKSNTKEEQTKEE